MRFRDAYDPFRALGGAWTLIRRAPATILTGGFLIAIFNQGPSFGFELSGEDWEVALACAVCMVALAFYLLVSLFSVGFATAVERVAVQGQERIGDLFRARGRYWSMVLGQILLALLIMAAAVPFVLVSAGVGFLVAAMGGEEAGVAVGALTFLLLLPALLYLWLGLAFVPHAIAFERKTPFEAVTRSLGLVRGNRLWLFWFYLVMIVFELLGLCCCGVGIIATTTVGTIASYEAYLRLVRDDHERWVIEGGAGAPLMSLAPDEPDVETW